MPTRDERKREAAKHLALMNGVFESESKASADAALIYEDGEGRELELPAAPFEETTTEVTTRFATDLIAHSAGKTIAVNPAAFTRPGGSYEDGGFGPEQALCAESNLYSILQNLKGRYYNKNRNYQSGGLFTDRALYITDVIFTRQSSMKRVDVIAIAEPQRARALENHRSERECDNSLQRRIETLLRIAAVHECETLICNAFGCGRDPQDDARVIEIFQAWIKAHPGAIKHIVFSVPRAHFDNFDAAFGKPKEEWVTKPVVDEEESQEEDFRSIELPEGVTFKG